MLMVSSGLSSATMKQNTALQARINDLQVELGVWQRAHSVVVEASEREARAHNVQMSTLNRQIAQSDTFAGVRVPSNLLPWRKTLMIDVSRYQNQNPLILCLINVDEHLFSSSLLEQGNVGGQRAAQILTQNIAEFLSQEDLNVFGRLSFWITLFLDRNRLAESLDAQGVCSVPQFNAFLSVQRVLLYRFGSTLITRMLGVQPSVSALLGC